MEPMAIGQILIDGQQDCSSPSKMFRPMKYVFVGRPVSTSIPIGNDIGQEQEMEHGPKANDPLDCHSWGFDSDQIHDTKVGNIQKWQYRPDS